LRREIGALLRDGTLAKPELEILTARYVREMTSQEVAAEMEITPANVRQLCRRRCYLLRHRLSGLDLEDALAA
jgi:DNA-directed RNA polymerase specialized sigma subunit